jgi:hypothetical protein
MREDMRTRQMFPHAERWSNRMYDLVRGGGQTACMISCVGVVKPHV